MTYLDLIRDADRQLDDGRITLGEYEKMIEPLNREIDHIAESGKKVERTAEIAQNVQNGDLILRKAAIESIRECAEVAHDNREWGMEQGYLNAIECVEEEPPAQPEIIRCKDCKHWRFDHTCREHSLVSPMMANEFCSRAERREG